MMVPFDDGTLPLDVETLHLEDGCCTFMMIGHFDEMLRLLEDDMAPFDHVTPFGGFEAPLEMKYRTLPSQCFSF
jgi:hypothetical protein